MAGIADRCRETSTSTGTGTINLAGTVTGFRTLVSGIGTGNNCYYAIVHQTLDEWEVGIGTVTDATPDTLSRTSVLSSSNAGSLVNFSAGTKDVFVTAPYDLLRYIRSITAGSGISIVDNGTGGTATISVAGLSIPMATSTATSAQTRTGSGSFQDVHDEAGTGALSATITTVDTGKIYCTATIRFKATDSAAWDYNEFKFLLDGTTSSSPTWKESIDEAGSASDFGATGINPFRVRTIHAVFSGVSAGSHTVKVQWTDAGAGSDISFSSRQITIWSDMIAAAASAPPTTLYVNASTGSDSTGTGLVGAPYATVTKALTRLPARLDTNYTIIVADGTYAEAVAITRFDGPGTLKIQGNTTTPANVNFTGSTSYTFEGTTRTSCLLAFGPVRVEFEGVKGSPTATSEAITAVDRATVIVDRCQTGGSPGAAVFALHYGYIEIQGDFTATGWTGGGISANRLSYVTQVTAGTLTLTGPGGDTTAQGIAATLSSTVRCAGVATYNWTITGVGRGLDAALCSTIQHYGTGGGSISITNSTKPTSSIGFRSGDCSTVSTDRPVTLNNFVQDFHGEANSYIEASSTRTLTNITTNTPNGEEVQGGYVYLP